MLAEPKRPTQSRARPSACVKMHTFADGTNISPACCWGPLCMHASNPQLPAPRQIPVIMASSFHSSWPENGARLTGRVCLGSSPVCCQTYQLLPSTRVLVQRPTESIHMTSQSRSQQLGKGLAHARQARTPAAAPGNPSLTVPDSTHTTLVTALLRGGLAALVSTWGNNKQASLPGCGSGVRWESNATRACPSLSVA